MPIYASRSGSRKTSNELSLKLSQDIEDGAILVFDNELNAFVDRDPSGDIQVSGGENIGDGIGVFHQNDGGTLQFRKISAGNEMSVTLVDDDIVIARKKSDAKSYFFAML